MAGSFSSIPTACRCAGTTSFSVCPFSWGHFRLDFLRWLCPRARVVHLIRSGTTAAAAFLSRLPTRARLRSAFPYWNLAYPNTAICAPSAPPIVPYPPPTPKSFGNSLLGLNRVPRLIDSVCAAPQWFAPFFFEDRRNVFYVTTAQTSLPFFSIGNYGHGIVNLNATSVPTIAGLVAGSIPYLTQKTPFSALIPSAGDPTEIGRYVQQGGNIKVAIGTVTPSVTRARRCILQDNFSTNPAHRWSRRIQNRSDVFREETMAALNQEAGYHYSADTTLAAEIVAIRCVPPPPTRSRISSTLWWES